MEISDTAADLSSEIQPVITMEAAVAAEDVVLSEVLPAPALTPAPVAAVVVNDPPMYKTDRGYNINVVALARDARLNLDSVKTICIPAPVKKHRINRAEYEAPTLSEVGGGGRNTFCQVIASKQGRSVEVDNIHYINTDPKRTNINHGTASVAIGNYFAIGWTMKADIVILIYEIVSTSEYVSAATAARAQVEEDRKPVAKLTCNLVGYEITDWKRSFLDVPAYLNTLLEVTRHRMRNDTDFPFYMDIFRMVKANPALNYIAEEATSGEYLEHNESDYQFMTNVMKEIFDIRFFQYEPLPPPPAKRKVDQLRLVETLKLDELGNYIDITLTPVRTDNFELTTFRLRLTRSNFEDATGRLLLERNLTLNHIGFDSLKLDLEGRKDKIVTVQLTSLR